MFRLQAPLLFLYIGAFCTTVQGEVVADSQGEKDTALVLDEVRVAARHREERAQDVPVALSVTDGAALAEAGIYTIETLQQRVPSLLVAVPSARYASYGIRGLGLSSFNDGMDGSVGVFLDGVYQGRQGMAIHDLVDLERVEVLRGPQSTLYGKNTSAGAINVISRMPTFTPEAAGELSYGEHDLRQYRATVSGALVDGVLAGRLTGYDVTRDGTIDNLYQGIKQNDQNRQGLRGQLLWTPTEVFSVRLIGEYGGQDERGNIFTSSSYSRSTLDRMAYLGYRPLPLDPYSRDILQDGRNAVQIQHTGATLQLDYQLSDAAALTSITAYRDWSYDTVVDSDGMSLSVADSGARLDQHQFSQELRLAGSASDSLDYLIGLYYLRQRFNRHVDVTFGKDATKFFLGDRPEITALGISPGMIPTSLLDGARQDVDGGQRSDSNAVFGQLTWRPTEKLAITPGLRYTRERKQGSITRAASGLAPLPQDPLDPLTPIWQWGGQLLRDSAFGTDGGRYSRKNSIVEGDLSVQLAVSYQLRDNLLGYVSWAQGYKAGGINLDVVGPYAAPTFGSEKVNSYEAGLKSSFWDGRMLFDLAIYQAEVDGYQALTNSRPADQYAPPLRDNLINVGKVRLRGVEIDALLRASERIDLRFGAAWSDARYRDFPNAPCKPGNAQVTCDLSGNRLFNAPEWSVTAGADYVRPLGSGLEGFAGVDYSFRSGYYGALEAGAGSYQAAYGITNVKIGLRRENRRWEMELWSRNLFNRQYITAVYAALGEGDYGVVVGDPRSAGLTVRARL